MTMIGITKRGSAGAAAIVARCIVIVAVFSFGGLAASIAPRGGGSRSVPSPANEGPPPIAKNGSGGEEKLAAAIDSSAGGQREMRGAVSDAFTVLEQVGHDKSSFTQGLSYGHDAGGNAYLFETTGLYGRSKVRRIDPTTFEVEASVDVDSKYFGEGSAFFTDSDGNPRLVELTWKEQTGFIYDAGTLEQLREFRYATTAPGHEGWGITYDASKGEFIVSDGTAHLYFWDRDTLAEKRKVTVTRLDGSEQDRLNELEYMDGLICCNIWYTDDIVCVDPITGRSVREYDMSSLWPKDQRGDANVMNGIALGPDHVLITGKLWDRMYKVVFPDWSTLFASASNDDPGPSDPWGAKAPGNAPPPVVGSAVNGRKQKKRKRRRKRKKRQEREKRKEEGKHDPV